MLPLRIQGSVRALPCQFLWAFHLQYLMTMEQGQVGKTRSPEDRYHSAQTVELVAQRCFALPLSVSFCSACSWAFSLLRLLRMF